MKDTQSEILNFWFIETEPSQWFHKSDEFDETIKMRFEDDYHMSATGIFDSWLEGAKGCLALCILLDQFPRNMFRDSPKAFATDKKP